MIVTLELLFSWGGASYTRGDAGGDEYIASPSATLVRNRVSGAISFRHKIGRWAIFRLADLFRDTALCRSV